MRQGEIGARVRARVRDLTPARSQREIAAEVGMTPDAFSRALSDLRAFSAIELARIAEVVEADVHWLITGQPDPFRLAIAARHEFDAVTGNRAVPGLAKDEPVLADIGLAYHQAYAGKPPESPQQLPKNVAAVRAALGEGFVRPFIDRLEQNLGVDVVRLKELSTSYCFTTAKRNVIVVAASGNWFWENYALAHEVGHLVLGHLDLTVNTEHEAAANQFAAELLMPAAEMRSLNWTQVSAAGLAARVWDLGVSTSALSNRLTALGLRCSGEVRELLGQRTQRLLRHHWEPPPAWTGRELGSGWLTLVDAITERMQAAATRRFPKRLEEAHLDKIATGELGKATLGWMLGITADQLDVETPAEQGDGDLDKLSDSLGLER